MLSLKLNSFSAILRDIYRRFGNNSDYIIFGRSHVLMQKDNRKAPDADVTLSDGSVRRLSEFWKTQKLVLVFIRHYG